MTLDMIPMNMGMMQEEEEEEASDSSFDDDEDYNLERKDLKRKDGSSSSKEEKADSPEVIVRRENQYVTVLRVLVILVLLGAAAGVVTFVYRYTKDSETSTFNNEYDAVSTTILDSFQADLSLKLYAARTLSNFVSAVYKGKPDAKPWTLDLPQDNFFGACFEIRTALNAHLVAYSPLIHSEEGRKEFEAYAAAYEEEHGPFTAGPHDVCNLCDDPTHGTTTPDVLTTTTSGFGARSCELLEIESQTGNYGPRRCSNHLEWYNDGCSCGPVEADTSLAAAKSWSAANGMFRLGEEGALIAEEDHAYRSYITNDGSWDEDEGTTGPLYLPIWQATGTAIRVMPTMYNQMSDPQRAEILQLAYNAKAPEFSKIIPRTTPYYTTYFGLADRPGSFFYYPVGDIIDGEYFGNVTGFLTIEFAWESFLTSIFPPNSDNVDVVVENECAGNHTFTVNTEYNVLEYVGPGDLHEAKYNHMVRATTYSDFSLLTRRRMGVHPDNRDAPTCSYRFMLFPTKNMEDQYVTNEPVYYATAAGFIFAFTSVVFIMYDAVVRRRQEKVMESAIRTSDIVTSLFPKNVRDRMYEQVHAAREKEKAVSVWGSGTSKMHMQAFLVDGRNETVLGAEPIADLFPHATVCFIDIANFTAWSSERGPEGVFKLLEGLYQEFDDIARSMKVFKIETIGDSYMAVCGAPQPRKDHAVVMARFAKKCLKRMSNRTRELETTLGPDTGDLRARVGMHSGPIIAGVLRGEKARFQLFGDTVNMASRMESTGQPHRIHASKTTVDLLMEAGKVTWIKKRDGLISVKGKGELQTYWIEPRGGRGSTGSLADSLLSESTASDDLGFDTMNALGQTSDQWKSTKAFKVYTEKTMRLVDWNVKVLSCELEKIVKARRGGAIPPSSPGALVPAEKAILHKRDGSLVMDELTHVVHLPKFDAKRAVAVVSSSNNDAGLISDRVKEQLHDFTLRIANMYNPQVPFHNFEHASHVIMSAAKMMKRILQPDGIDYALDGCASEKDRQVAVAQQIHNYTYGMSSDPLMQFTVVFSALIHDVDHTGLTNKELVEMKTPLAKTYREQSVAEQNSIDLAWSVLMEDKYRELRSCIYSTKAELKRFRELLVNAVMATDIADKQLQALRKDRWMACFDNLEASKPEEALVPVSAPITAADSNRKATITYEYIIQASDVSHTMQHWNTFRKFNKRLFEERYVAWLKGVAGEHDPSVGWYKGEIGFFDFYVIPLARKLEVCGVFGVSHHEYLFHAQQNRKEWEDKGEKLTAEMLRYCENKYKYSMGSTPMEEDEEEDEEV